ncbi:MAG TPA: GTP cyclohydrolase I FolE [Elusimicrobiales bacterium]|nr:GTP cyclohydrolase I FolE [Elusimicrobiales bacterium]
MPKKAKNKISETHIVSSIKKIIEFIGENPSREGLKDTPMRMINSWKELFGGYGKNPKALFKTFTEGACREMIVLKNVEFYSTCEHHFLPFMGTISIGYIPDKKIIGISKLARLIEIYSRRLQVQEKLVAEIADSIMDNLKPKGVMVVCRAKHLCISARGIQKHHAEMITSALRGIFRRLEVREEFLQFLQKP